MSLFSQAGELSHHVSALLERCTHLSHLNQLHAFLITLGQAHLPLLSFKLLRFCTTTLGGAHIDHARLIFDHKPAPSVYHWTAIITAYQMHFNSVAPNQFTFPYILKASAQIFALLETAQTHAHIAKSGFGAWAVVRTALVDAYAKCGVLEAARRALGEMHEPNVASFTALLTGFAKFGKMGDTFVLFEEMRERDVPAWNAAIAGCAQNGLFVEALSLFNRMLAESHQPNHMTLVCVLSACAHLGTLGIGGPLHAHAYKCGSGASPFVGNALIDMYAKCGCLKEACKFFDRMRERSITAWNSMTNGLALHGHTREAIEIFNKTQVEKVRPDEVTVVGVLNACTHGGLIDEGCSYFLSMKKDYGLEPRIGHYGCVVDLLGRAGCLEEAIEVIEGMKQEPDDVIWGTLLNACRMHGNVGLAESNGSYMVQLANFYGEKGKWEEVGRLARDGPMEKTSGCSWIEMDGEVVEFYSADGVMNGRAEEVYSVLELLVWQLRNAGHMPDLT
ncbi:hypothetical protein AMTRI_Chr02g256570 [Amborella trichopoda]